MRRVALLAAALAAIILAGCGYYRITDPASGRVYYTNDWIAGRYTWTGALRFHDAASGQEVTLTSSEVEKISASEYRRAIGAP